MPPETIVNIIQSLIGALVGAVVGGSGVFVALRKMPTEINNVGSSTLKNVLESNRLLSDRLEKQEDEITELRGWFTGTLEITTRVELTNPPRVLTADIRKIPAKVSDRV